MKTFIRACEVWVPSTDRTMLEFGGGLYGKATRFAAISRNLCFGRGEGLPGQACGAIAAAPDHLALDRGQGTIGKVFLTGVPAMSDNAASEPGGWGELAAEIGLESLVAMPVIHEGRLSAVAAWYL